MTINIKELQHWEQITFWLYCIRDGPVIIQRLGLMFWNDEEASRTSCTKRIDFKLPPSSVEQRQVPSASTQSASTAIAAIPVSSGSRLSQSSLSGGLDNASFKEIGCLPVKETPTTVRKQILSERNNLNSKTILSETLGIGGSPEGKNWFSYRNRASPKIN